MRWEKKGLIYSPSLDQKSWMYKSALTPTPFLIDEETIRVYFGARDVNGVSRIGFIDLCARNPSVIKRISKDPALDIGEDGTFDDNGVILGDVILKDGDFYMFYVGFQKVNKVKFLAFSGVAISHDNGEKFTRLSKTPILDRSDEGCYIRAIHTAMFHDNFWKIWYAAGDGWEMIDGIPYPQYNIFYLESDNLMTLPKKGYPCISVQGDEYRIGRPKVYIIDDHTYEMYYTKGCVKKTYFPGFALSTNGLDWVRRDENFPLALSKDGWDSETLCYPSFIRTQYGTYLFYNGNNMGADGFGYAVLTEE